METKYAVSFFMLLMVFFYLFLFFIIFLIIIIILMQNLGQSLPLPFLLSTGYDGGVQFIHPNSQVLGDE